MLCSKCGAAVAGNYCSVCGQKIRSQLEEFRVQERRRKRAFLEETRSRDGLPAWHLADACWTAAASKYLTNVGIGYRRISDVYPDAYVDLERTAILARQLYSNIIDLLKIC